MGQQFDAHFSDHAFELGILVFFVSITKINKNLQLAKSFACFYGEIANGYYQAD
jgi:hypothetical protein